MQDHEHMATTSDPISLESLIPAGRGASRRLAEILRQRLTSGQLAPGDQLPTQRALMRQFGVGYSVANRAMEILAREGLIDRQQGHGTFVSESASGAPAASRLGAIALVLSHSRWSFYSSLFQGMDTAAGSLQYQTIVCDTDNDPGRQAMILMQLIDKRVAGIAIVPTSQPETAGYQIRLCQEMGVPVVLLHRQVRDVSAPLISLPFEDIGYRIGKALVDRGHRQVAWVFDERYEATDRYEAGLRRALDGSAEACDLQIHTSGRRTIPINAEHEAFLGNMLDGILRKRSMQRPTAIVAIAEDDAEWIYMRLMKMGVCVPDEISLITVGSALRQREIDKQLTAVTLDEAGVGRLATQLLSEMGRGQRPITDNERFTAELGFHAGETLGLAPGATIATNEPGEG